MRRRLPQLMSTLLLATTLLGVTAAPVAEARPAYANASQSQLTAREAAAQAKAQYGGKVLRVRKQDDGYKVRLLQKSGRVITVTIRG